MDCSGALRTLPVAEVADQVPEKVKRYCREFFVCEDCGKVLWRGTHWLSISRRLRLALQMAETRRLRRRRGS